MALAKTLKATEWPGTCSVRVISTFRLPVMNESLGLSFQIAFSGAASETWASCRQFARNWASESRTAAWAAGKGNDLSPSKWIIGASGRSGGTVLAFYAD